MYWKRSPDESEAVGESGNEKHQEQQRHSPEVRLQPEDLSVTTKVKDKIDISVLSPRKTPELKLSVRKLLGCSPSPTPPPPPPNPPAYQNRSPSPDVKSHVVLESKSSNAEAQVSPRLSLKTPQTTVDDSAKGKYSNYIQTRKKNTAS